MRSLSRPGQQANGRPAVTLVELLTVIAIITILTTLGFYSFTYAKNFTDRIEGQANAAIAQVQHGSATPVPSGAPLPPPPPRPKLIPGQYYVGLKASATDASASAQRLAGLVGGRVLSVYTSVIHGFGVQCDDARIALLRSDPDVQFVDQARYVYPCQTPNNIKRVFCNGIHGSQKTPPTTNIVYGVPRSVYIFSRGSTARGIVNTRIYLSGSPASSTIAVLDTGIDKTHPDLNVVAEADFTGGNNPQDVDGHGTHVAGVVGAADATATGGVIGVFPGAPLINLKVMSKTNANNDTLLAGSNLFVYSALANYVIPNARFIRVCLMPFQTLTRDDVMNALVDAAGNAGVLMVAPSGSGGVAILAPSPGGISPASASQAIVAVGLLDTDGLAGGQGGAADDILSPGNNTGRADFAAPSGSAAAGYYLIRSTIPIAGMIQNGLATPYSTQIFGTPGAANNAAGTSFSAAHLAGTLAFLADPQTTVGFVVGPRTIPSFRPQMTNRAGAINALMQSTHQTASFQMINPLTGSAWVVAPTIPRIVTPYSKRLFNDSPGGIPVPNFYVNPAQLPANLTPFPG